MGPELLADQLTYNQRVVAINTDGLTQEDSLVAAPGGGNCLNWVVGHVVATRNGLLKLLGREPIWGQERAALYRRGSDPIRADNALPLALNLADYAASQETILAALRELTDDDLAAPTEVRFFKGDAETVGSALAGFVFHESYHVGQTGILRRVAGKAGAIQ
jgi:uncharacterized damage-inducible protein DinB